MLKTKDKLSPLQFDDIVEMMAKQQENLTKGQLILLTLLFVMGFGIRLIAINKAPLDFHPTRQYRFLLIARDYYWDNKKELSASQQEVGQANKIILNKLEPPFLEKISAWAYGIVGREMIGIPRSINVFLWMLGAFIFYKIARRLGSTNGAVVATALFIFLPFGIQASRALLPESLMLCLLLFSCLTLLKYNKSPSLKNLLIAAAVAALTLFVKTGFCVFIILSLFGALFYHNKKQGKPQPVSHLFIFIGLSVLPALLYMILVIKGETSGRSFWFLVFEYDFWRGLYTMLKQVYSIPILILVLFGYFSSKNKRGHLFLIAALLGFAVFSLFFTYHIQTHNYYHIQFIPFVCWGLMPVVDWVTRKNMTFFIVLGLVFGMSLKQSVTQISTVDYSVGITKKNKQPTTIKKEVELFQRIGDTCRHSTRIIALSYAYGAPLMYHGQVSVRPWNKMADIKIMELKGQTNIARNIEDQIKLYKEYDPQYFVITDFREYHRNYALETWLEKNCERIEKNDDFIIFEFKTK